MQRRAPTSSACHRKVASRLLTIAVLATGALAGFVRPGQAAEITGTVAFQGQVVFPDPIPGIAADDLDINVKPTTDSTEGGEKCFILSTTADNPDPDGTYPGASGSVEAEIKIQRGGGPQIPDGSCVITVQATGTDGVSVSARGSQTLFVSAAEVDAGATIAVPDITVRQSKAVAGLDPDCFRWVRRQIRKLRRCNILLLRKGAEGASRCTDAGVEPPTCDPGDFAEAIVALGHGVNDQQTDPLLAESVDVALLRAQVGCQRRFGGAALGYAFKRLRLLWRQCINNNADSPTCREDRSRESTRPLDRVDGCSVDQLADPENGRPVPDVGAPCDVCIDDITGTIDRKCLKSCFQQVLDELTDGIIGDVALCGNGILQPGESCDDGNTIPGDCCSETCIAETPSTEGPLGDPTCEDLLDNDCDGAIDGADPDCQ